MIYKNISSMINNVSKMIISHGYDGQIQKWQGVDDFQEDPIKEMINLYFIVPMINNQSILAKETKADLPWAEDHFQERINPKNRGKALNPGYSYKYWPYANFKDQKDDFVRLNKKFSHTYMERFWPPNKKGIRFKYGNWGKFIENANKNPLSRQLYFPIYFPEDVQASLEGERIPCSLGYHFQVFHGLLHLSYFIRSCDLHKHFRNDIYFTIRLAQELKNKVSAYKNLTLGNLNIWIGNLHCFINDIYKIKKWVN